MFVSAPGIKYNDYLFSRFQMNLNQCQQGSCLMETSKQSQKLFHAYIYQDNYRLSVVAFKKTMANDPDKVDHRKKIN